MYDPGLINNAMIYEQLSCVLTNLSLEFNC